MRDCLTFRAQLGIEAVPQSFIDRLPKGANAACALEDGRWLYDAGNGNKQYLSLFGTIFQVLTDEVAPLDGVNKAKPISHEGTDFMERLDFTIPNEELVRSPGSPRVYHVVDNQLHYIGGPATANCLSARSGKSVRLVPQDLVNRMQAMGRVGADAYCEFEGRLMLSPNGVDVVYIKDGYKRPVTNPVIRDCLIGRAGTGVPFQVEQTVWDRYTPGEAASCPYPAEVRFVRGNGQPQVWRVFPDGTRQHAASLCAANAENPATDPRFRVHVMPAGEVDGHRMRSPDTFHASPGTCGAIL